MTYDCARCGKSFAYNKDLKNHLLSKKVCETTINNISREELLKKMGVTNLPEFKCDDCNKTFVRKDHYNSHINHCKKNKNDQIADLQKQIEELKQQNSVIQKKYTDLKQQTKKLKKTKSRTKIVL